MHKKVPITIIIKYLSSSFLNMFFICMTSCLWLRFQFLLTSYVHLPGICLSIIFSNILSVLVEDIKHKITFCFIKQYKNLNFYIENEIILFTFIGVFTLGSAILAVLCFCFLTWFCGLFSFIDFCMCVLRFIKIFILFHYFCNYLFIH